MISNVEQYLAELRKELSGCDRATVQDALSDAEEYLRTALGSRPPDTAGAPDAAWTGTAGAEALAQVIERYGVPAEIAAAYKQMEQGSPFVRRSDGPPGAAAPGAALPPAPVSVHAAGDRRSFLARFFGVFAEPRAWGSLLYLMLAMVTGTIYFTWVVTGLSLSVGLLILIIGLPLAGLFLLSVRGIALIEGRLVEALLWVRMPRRPRFSGPAGIWPRFKNLIVDKRTWFSMVYMLLQMPLGIIYFTLLITLATISLSLIAWPIVALVLGAPVFVTSFASYYATGWLILPSVVCGGLLITVTMHLAKAIGTGHGAMAKALLVRP